MAGLTEFEFNPDAVETLEHELTAHENFIQILVPLTSNSP